MLAPMRSVVAWIGGGPGHWTCPKEQREGDILPLPERFEEEKPALRLRGLGFSKLLPAILGLVAMLLPVWLCTSIPRQVVWPWRGAWDRTASRAV